MKICDCSLSNLMPYTDKKKRRWLLTCAPISELPSNINIKECEIHAGVVLPVAFPSL